jgi:four helix bundle protein
LNGFIVKLFKDSLSMSTANDQTVHYLKLNDMKSYKVAFDLSNYIWDVAVKMDYCAKNTIGKQFTKVVDSISANIVEGFGRYEKKDKIKFYRNSKGSLKESLDGNEKCMKRGLTSTEEYNYMLET